MRTHQLSDRLQLLVLRIPMRGYEIIDDVGAENLLGVTNPHEGL